MKRGGAGGGPVGVKGMSISNYLSTQRVYDRESHEESCWQQIPDPVPLLLVYHLWSAAGIVYKLVSYWKELLFQRYLAPELLLCSDPCSHHLGSIECQGSPASYSIIYLDLFLATLWNHL